MNLEESLFAQLSTISTLKSRIYPLNAPEGITTPYLIYELTNTERIKTLTGHDGALNATYQLTIIANTYSQLKSLADSVRLLLLNFTGEMGGTGGVIIQNTTVLNQFEMYYPETVKYQGVFEIQFFYIESIT